VRLLLVAPSNSYRVGAFLEAARSMGCEVVVATDRASAIPGSSLCVPFDDPAVAADGLLERCCVPDAVVGTDGDAVVGTDGDAVLVAAEVARRLGLPGNPSAAVSAADDKVWQRRLAAFAGVPQPGFAIVHDDLDWTSFPAVVKPARRSASQGVIRADDAAELVDIVGRVNQIASGSPVLVEEYVAGTEVAVEGLLRGGQLQVFAVFDKPDTPTGPTFPETLLISPARLAPEVLERVVDVAERAVAAVGLVEGPVHVECKVNGAQVWFLELAARTIGGLCSRALDHGGVSLEELVIRHALGSPLPTCPPSDATGVLMLPVPNTGRLESLQGVEAARAVAGITEVTITIGPGDWVQALPEGDRYLGFVFAKAGTPDQVEAALREAWAALRADIIVS